MVYLFWAATRGRCFTASVASRKQRSRWKLVASLDNKFPMSSTVAQIFRAAHFEQLSLELNLDPKQNQIRQLSELEGAGDRDILAVAGCCNIYSLSLREKKKLMTCFYFAAWTQHCLPSQSKKSLAMWGQRTRYDTNDYTDYCIAVL